MIMSDTDESVNLMSASFEEKGEPQLKYEGIFGDVQQVLSKESASCIFVNSKLLVLGTNFGKIHVFDHQGNWIKVYHKHSESVVMISMDINGDYVASCSSDRKVVVQAVYSQEICYNINSNVIVKSIAIEPLFRRGSSKNSLLVGGHQVILYESGLFGSVKSSVLYEPPTAFNELTRKIEWKGKFMAWAMDSAIRVMDMDTKVIVSLIKRDHSLALGCDQYPPHLCWKNDSTLLVGWGDSVKICCVRERTKDLSKYAALDISPYYMEITCMFNTNFYLCGVAPLDDILVVLSLNKSSSIDLDSDDRSNSDWRRPQIRVLQPDQNSYEELSMDILDINGFQNFEAVHYHLAELVEDRRFYIVCPQNVILAKPRESNDKLKWLIDHQKFGEALKLLEQCGDTIGNYTTLDVGQMYMNYLILTENFSAAAKIASKILGENKQLWEQAVIRFHKLDQVKHLCPYIPTGYPQPTLTSQVYQAVLFDLLKSDHNMFLDIIKAWPKNIYSVSVIIHKVLEVLTMNPNNSILLQSLAVLYSNVEKYDKAVSIYLKLKNKDLFDLIRRFSLYECVVRQIIEMMSLDEKSTLDICVQNVNVIPPEKVVKAISNHSDLLYKYLDALHTGQRDASQPYQNELLRLYSKYDKSKILPLLYSSSNIDLEPALDIVQAHGMIEETVYLLIRMGSTESALKFVLEEERDIRWAVKICQENSDPELWKYLINYSLDKPGYIRVLLENIGVHVNPLLILRYIPSNMEIPGLRDAVLKIINDYQLKITLQNNYQKIFVTDSMMLLEKQISNLRAAIPVRSDFECGICCQRNSTVGVSDLEIVVFGCRHIYHAICLSFEEPNFQKCIKCDGVKKMSRYS